MMEEKSKLFCLNPEMQRPGTLSHLPVYERFHLHVWL